SCATARPISSLMASSESSAVESAVTHFIGRTEPFWRSWRVLTPMIKEDEPLSQRRHRCGRDVQGKCRVVSFSRVNGTRRDSRLEIRDQAKRSGMVVSFFASGISNFVFPVPTPDPSSENGKAIRENEDQSRIRDSSRQFDRN